MLITFRPIEPLPKELGFLIGNLTEQKNPDSKFESTTVSTKTLNDMIK